MSATISLARSEGAGADPSLRAWLRRALREDRLRVAALLVVWALCNPYFEIDRSSVIYAVRALADLDAAGIGRDIMFRLDGQSGFTLFTLVFRLITAAAGSATATMLVAAASLLASFAGAMVLARSLCAGRANALAVLFAATLPACYGGFNIFSYAETAATPRPFAEALVLCGLAALVRGRPGLAVLAMAGAAILHPIMALAGLGVLVVMLVAHDRRWLAAPALAGLAILALAAAGIAPFDRLLAPIDPVWKAILVERNPHLFPSLWPEGWIGRAAARVATLLIAASLAPPPVRRLFLATVVVGLSGLAVAYLVNERLPLVLLVQMQTWRAMWLVFSLGTFAAAICVVDLWTKGGAARVVLLLLALAWVYADRNAAAAMIALAAVGLHFGLDARRHPFSTTTLKAILGVGAVVLVVGLAATEWSIARGIGHAPAALMVDAWRTLAVDWDYTPLAALAAVWVMHGRPRLGRRALAASTLVGLLLLAVSWDRRSAVNRRLDDARGAADLVEMVADRPGEIYWIGGVRESWTWLGRPQWLSALQGAGIVFSRDLAMLYRARAQRAIDAGLTDAGAMMPLSVSFEDEARAIRFSHVASFCAAADAPAWIVAPLEDGQSLPAHLRAVEWLAPAAKLVPSAGRDGALAWTSVARYAVIPCAGA